MERIAGLHLRIPMNAETKWVLDKKHIRVACRHMVSHSIIEPQHMKTNKLQTLEFLDKYRRGIVLSL